jgi:hypothetical protein
MNILLQYEVVLFYIFSDAYVYNLNWSVPLFWWLCSFIYFILSIFDFISYFIKNFMNGTLIYL